MLFNPTNQEEFPMKKQHGFTLIETLLCLSICIAAGGAAIAMAATGYNPIVALEKDHSPVEVEKLSSLVQGISEVFPSPTSTMQMEILTRLARPDLVAVDWDGKEVLVTHTGQKILVFADSAPYGVDYIPGTYTLAYPAVDSNTCAGMVKGLAPQATEIYVERKLVASGGKAALGARKECNAPTGGAVMYFTFEYGKRPHSPKFR